MGTLEVGLEETGPYNTKALLHVILCINGRVGNGPVYFFVSSNYDTELRLTG